MKVAILCSFGPSCVRVARARCTVCNGHYCKDHSGHGTGHATTTADFAACGHPLVDGRPLCERKQ